MKIRGERECTDCGTRWSYYETGSVGCPACGSLLSVGLDERTVHTDSTSRFDLTAVRAAIDDVPDDELADRARDTARAYVRTRGFVSGGTLRDLDDEYLAANELRYVAARVGRERSLSEDESLYFLSLLRDADDGERPAAEEVPQSIRGSRGLAYANAVREYRRDVRTWADDRNLTDAERSALETLGEHATRIRLLDGDVDPVTAERLVESTRDLADGLRGDETALEIARERLERLEVGDP
ncbi:DUF7117 family protein [Natrarchaeobaculum aegyptiacum]|uniref:Uncharacterized protein n=1 Tax=Natrarchaeobaculum aegyptiacum TaxID=745377 RepID=A0A2Z2HPL6_9EURY|nr:hypothetical protein [Natrarchaeobaculum aegyptiacum]ARS88979.1 hypothetical protein B1756_03905 [Natrarchaeobaculum aegyptiacum]